MFVNRLLSRKICLDINSAIGITVSLTLILLWLVSLVWFLNLDLTSTSIFLTILGILIRTFFQTGLFITTHEAIHQNICQNNRINRTIGQITSFLYALLPYQTLAKNHQLHHKYPTTEKDPDFNYLGSNNFWFWYVSFMQKYQKGKQVWILLFGMTIIFCSLLFLQISLLNIFFFWVAPILISSLQLFTFGIFLPHRQQDRKYCDCHCARSNNYSVFWSLITCYHFGYHWEHHQYPYLPWYKLPLARQNTLKAK